MCRKFNCQCSWILKLPLLNHNKLAHRIAQFKYCNITGFSANFILLLRKLSKARTKLMVAAYAYPSVSSVNINS